MVGEEAMVAMVATAVGEEMEGTAGTAGLAPDVVAVVVGEGTGRTGKEAKLL